MEVRTGFRTKQGGYGIGGRPRGIVRPEVLAISLSLFFVGLLLLLFDVRLDSFDLLHDVLGATLILVGVVMAATQHIPGPQDARMILAMFGASGTVVLAVVEEFGIAVTVDGVDLLPLLTLVGTLFLLVGLHAFSLGMEGTTAAMGLQKAPGRWGNTVWLFVAVYELPLATFYLAAVTAFVLNGAFRFHWETALAVPLLLFFLLPVGQLFRAITITRRELRPGQKRGLTTSPGGAV